MIQSRRLSRQRGASLISLLVLAIVVGFFMLIGARAFPAVNEYLTIRQAVNKIMRANPASPTDIRSSFEKTVEVEYSIHTISASDLNIQVLGDTGRIRTSFAYNAEVEIFDPVYLMFKFSGSATSGGAKGF